MGAEACQESARQDAQTLLEDASMPARMGADGLSFIIYLTDGGHTIPGCFAAPRSFDWLYIRLKSADGTPMEIMAPAETAEQAMIKPDRDRKRALTPAYQRPFYYSSVGTAVMSFPKYFSEMRLNSPSSRSSAIA